MHKEISVQGKKIAKKKKIQVMTDSTLLSPKHKHQLSQQMDYSSQKNLIDRVDFIVV